MKNPMRQTRKFDNPYITVERGRMFKEEARIIGCKHAPPNWFRVNVSVTAFYVWCGEWHKGSRFASDFEGWTITQVDESVSEFWKVGDKF